MTDFFQLASGFIALGASVIPFLLAARIFRKSNPLFLLSCMFGLALLVHGAYRLDAFQGETLVGSELEFLSATLLLGAAVWYTYLRRSG